MHCALPPSETPDGERPRCFRLAAVGGAQLRGGWHLSAIVRLQGFSSGSPAASPHQWSPKTVTTSSMVGRSKPGCGLCPALSFKDLHHPCWGGGQAEPELYLPRGLASRFSLRHLGVETILQLCEGGVLQPCQGRRTAAAQPGCSIPSFVRATVASRTGRVSQHVVCREGGARVLGWSHSHFRGEDGSEDLPVRFGAADACWCGVGGQVDAAVGAEVVAAGEGFSADDIAGVSCAPGLRLFGFNVWFLSPVRGHEREPPRRWRLPRGHRCCCRGRRRATQSLSSRRPSDVEVVHTRGSGTGVPFVMAP
jgi:hypothetical protein